MKYSFLGVTYCFAPIVLFLVADANTYSIITRNNASDNTRNVILCQVRNHENS